MTAPAKKHLHVYCRPSWLLPQRCQSALTSRWISNSRRWIYTAQVLLCSFFFNLISRNLTLNGPHPEWAIQFFGIKMGFNIEHILWKQNIIVSTEDCLKTSCKVNVLRGFNFNDSWLIHLFNLNAILNVHLRFRSNEPLVQKLCNPKNTLKNRFP